MAGQAKRRGTFEERRAAAIQAREKRERARAEARASAPVNREDLGWLAVASVLAYQQPPIFMRKR